MTLWMFPGLLLAQVPVLALEPIEDGRAVLVLPFRVAGGARAARSAAPHLENVLTGALARHSPLRVISAARVRRALEETRQQLLSGEGAAAQLDGLGVDLASDFLVASDLSVHEATWTLRTALLERRTATVVRSASVRARDQGALLTSLALVAQQLAGGVELSLRDPLLAFRLGTNRATSAELTRRTPKDTDLAAAWTETLVNANRESEPLAAAEGGVILLGGCALLSAGLVPACAGAGHELAAKSVSQTALGQGDDAFPVLVPFLGLALVLPFPLVTLAALAIAGALGIVDVMDLGRIPVRRDGCCRNEEFVRGAEAPGWGRRVAPILSAMGAAAGLATGCTMFGGTLCFSCCSPDPMTLPSRDAFGPTVTMAGAPREALEGLSRAGLYGVALAAVLTYASGAFVATGLLGSSASSTVVDDVSEDPTGPR